MNSCCDRDLTATADWLSAFNRLSWREVLAGLGRQGAGLHRYRELRARALADALDGCERSRCRQQD